MRHLSVARSCGGGVCDCEDRGSARWQINDARTACEWAIKKKIGESCVSVNDCYYYSEKTATCNGGVCECPDADMYWTGTRCQYSKWKGVQNVLF